MSSLPTEETKIAVLENEMKHLNLNIIDLGGKIDSLHTKLDDNYLKKADFNNFYTKEFEPVKTNIDKLNYFYIKMTGVAAAIAFSLIYLPAVLKKIVEGIIK